MLLGVPLPDITRVTTWTIKVHVQFPPKRLCHLHTQYFTITFQRGVACDRRSKVAKKSLLCLPRPLLRPSFTTSTEKMLRGTEFEGCCLATERGWGNSISPPLPPSPSILLFSTPTRLSTRVVGSKHSFKVTQAEYFPQWPRYLSVSVPLSSGLR